MVFSPDPIDVALDTYYWLNRTGKSLPVRILGARLASSEPPTGLLGDVLMGACVDVAIGLRPHINAMN